jgi:hypothetical protein
MEDGGSGHPVYSRSFIFDLLSSIFLVYLVYYISLSAAQIWAGSCGAMNWRQKRIDIGAPRKEKAVRSKR